MIRIDPRQEPPALAAARSTELPRVRAIAATRDPTTDDFGKGYKPEAVVRALQDAQFNKCCYCERFVEDKYHDVEHYRPKARADRTNGSIDPGYWWLAWTWSNLLFSCNNCNRPNLDVDGRLVGKGDRFPLATGSIPLVSELAAPGGEMPLLLDPANRDVDPIDHIQFQRVAGYWRPTPRRGSPLGQTTIEILGLDRQSLLTLYNEHVESLQDALEHVASAGQSGDGARILQEWRLRTSRWIRRSRPFAGLSHDVFDHRFGQRFRVRWGLTLPRP